MAKPTSNRTATGTAILDPRRARIIRLCALAFVVIVVALIFLVPRGKPPPPSPAQPDQAFVDRVGMVTPKYARSMAGSLLDDPRMEIVVYIDALPPAGNLEPWTVQAATDWNVGTAKNDTGLVLFVFRDARLARAEVGYGLEGVLTDARMHRLLEEKLVPPFSRGEYEAGFDAFIKSVRDEMGGDAAMAQAAIEAVKAPRDTLGASIESAFHRVPRMLHVTWRNYVEGSAGERLGLLIFAGVGFGIVAIGIALAVNTVWRLATLPRNLRASSGRGGTFQLVSDIKLVEIVAGVVGFGLCFAMTVVILLQAENFMTRKGHFGGGGVGISWPAPPR